MVADETRVIRTSYIFIRFVTRVLKCVKCVKFVKVTSLDAETVVPEIIDALRCWERLPEGLVGQEFSGACVISSSKLS